MNRVKEILQQIRSTHFAALWLFYRKHFPNDETCLQFLHDAILFNPTPESPVTQYIYYILRFSNIQQAVAFSKTVTYPVDTSELYKMGSEYYLTVLIDTENQPIQYPTWLLATIREYADDSEVTRAVLQEHGYLLMVSGAIENLKKVASL